MPNLKGIGLQNFRTFKDYEYLEFAPITLITGANNSGKSSIFKAIMLLKENLGELESRLKFETLQHQFGTHSRILNNSLSFTVKELQKQDDLDISIINQDLNNDLVFKFPVSLNYLSEYEIEIELRYEIRLIKEKIELYLSQLTVFIDGSMVYECTGIEIEEDSSSEEKDARNVGLNNNFKFFLPLIYQLILSIDFEDKSTYRRRGVFRERNQISSQRFLSLKHFIAPSKLFLVKDFIEQFKRKDESEQMRIIEEVNYLIDNVIPLLIDENYSQYGGFYSIDEMFNFPNYKYEDRERDSLTFVKEKIKSRNEADLFFLRYEKDEERREEMIKKANKEKIIVSDDYAKFISIVWDVSTSIIRDIYDSKSKLLSNVDFLKSSKDKNRFWYADENKDELSSLFRTYHELEKVSNKSVWKDRIDFIEKWLIKFNIAQKVTVVRDEELGISKVRLQTYSNWSESLIDLGYGVSQLVVTLMKIIEVAFKSELDPGDYYNFPEYKSSTLIIEEPEINLHPNLQSKLAEMFLEAHFKFNIQFMIETHSEYLIYKFQEYIGKGEFEVYDFESESESGKSFKKVTPSDIYIYYLNHPDRERRKVTQEDGSIEYKKYVNRVPIKEDGSIEYEKYFGTGFFDEQTNLKLSLLNIQRDRFVEAIDNIKEKLFKDSAKSEDEKLSELSDKIDKHFDKFDFPEYGNIVKLVVDETKIDSAKTLKYLTTGKYLLATLDEDADFSTVVIQYGRAVEHELIRVIEAFISDIATNPNRSNWLSQFNTQKNTLYSNLGGSTVMVHPTALNKNGNPVNYQPNLLRDFISGSQSNFKFGFIMHIFEFMYFISTDYNSDISNTYTDIQLFNQFDLFLQSRWTDYVNAKKSFEYVRFFRDERDKAAHTYANTITKGQAKDYVEKIEGFMKHW